MKCFKLASIGLLSSVLFPVAASSAGDPPRLGQASDKGFDKVLVVVLENTDSDQALAQPGLKSLAERGALLTRFHGEARPSQPNYLALVSGSTHGVRSNDPVRIVARHLGNLLEEKGRSWKAYLEGYPGACFQGQKSGRYVRKHNPFVSFSNVQDSAARCARMVPSSQLAQDARNRRLPDFSIYVPDLDNDGHDRGVAFADRWLSEKFLPSLGDRFPEGLLLVVTFDESGTTEDNGIYTVLYGAGVRPGSTWDERADHTSLLKLVEDRFRLGTLGRGDQSAPPITGIWKEQ